MDKSQESAAGNDSFIPTRADGVTRGLRAMEGGRSAKALVWGRIGKLVAVAILAFLLSLAAVGAAPASSHAVSSGSAAKSPPQSPSVLFSCTEEPVKSCSAPQ